MTETETPVPTGVPPQFPEYQCHVAPADKVPVSEIVDDAPAEQMEVGFAFVAVGALGEAFTLIVTLVQVEEQKVFSALTKYVVVVVGETLNEAPVPTAVPPHDPEYQCQVAPAVKDPVTCNVVDLPEQIGEVPVAETGFEGVAETFMVLLTQAEKQLPFSALT